MHNFLHYLLVFCNVCVNILAFAFVLYVYILGRIVSYINISFCIGGSLRGKGWKYGSGFVDGIFPVLSPTAQQILKFVQKEVDSNAAWDAFDSLSPTHATWDDLINVSVQLRLNKKWDPIVLVRNSAVLLFYSTFQMCLEGGNGLRYQCRLLRYLIHFM